MRFWFKHILIGLLLGLIIMPALAEDAPYTPYPVNYPIFGAVSVALEPGAQEAVDGRDVYLHKVNAPFPFTGDDLLGTGTIQNNKYLINALFENYQSPQDIPPGEYALSVARKQGIYLYGITRSFNITGKNGFENIDLVLKKGEGPYLGALHIVTDYLLPDAEKGIDYSYILEAEGGEEPYKWSEKGIGLPPGWKVEENGRVHGMPNEPGVIKFVASVTDKAGNIDEKTFYIIVAPAHPSIYGIVYDKVKAELTGVIFDGAIKGASIKMGGQVVAASDSFGYYSIEGVNPGVQVKLECSTVGYETLINTVTILGDKPTRQDFPLGAKVVVQGTNDGPVILNISRLEQNLIVTWKIDTENYPTLSPNTPINVFVLPGGGTGSYTNLTGGWVQILENLSPQDNAGNGGIKVAIDQIDKAINWNMIPSEKKIVILNQVGLNDAIKELYFKALPATDAWPATTFLPAVMSVGKVDVIADMGISVISYPFETPVEGEPITNVFDSTMLQNGSKFNADLIMLKQNAKSWNLPSAFIDLTNQWKDYDNPQNPPIFTISDNVGYYLWRRAPGSKTITLAGKVPKTVSFNFITDILVKPITVFGLGLPVAVNLADAGLSSNTGDKFHADLIMVKESATSWVLKSAYRDANGIWNDYDTNLPTQFKLRLPYGYYYWNRGNQNVAWIRNL